MLAIIRIRGTVGATRELRDTLRMLRLDAVNNCVLLPETKNCKGMIDKVKDHVTYGEIEKTTLAEMIKKRLRMFNNKRVDGTMLKKVTDFDSFEDFAEVLIEGNIRLKNFKELQPIFRLTPPSKGFKSTKDHYPRGDLGHRGKEINSLLERMI